MLSLACTEKTDPISAVIVTFICKSKPKQQQQSGVFALPHSAYACFNE